MNAYLYPLLSALAGVITALTGYWVLKRRLVAEVEADRARAGIRREDMPLDILRDALKNAYGEVAAARSELRQSNERILTEDLKWRETMIESTTQIKDAMLALRDSMLAHREEERQRAAQAHEDHEMIGNRLTAIEVRVGLRSIST